MNRNWCRKVVDKSMLGHKHRQHVIEYLEQSVSNQLVVTDCLLLESVAGNALGNFSTDFGPLKRFSEQLIVLKPMHDVCSLNPGADLGERMICQTRTDEMHNLWRWLPRMEIYGPDRTFQEMTDNYQRGREQVLETMPDVRDYFERIAAKWPQDEVNALRHRRKIISDSFGEIIMSDITDMARQAYADIPDEVVPPYQQAIYSFQFRFCLCCVLLLALNLVRSDLRNIDHATLRSHLIDMSYVAYATFFDGILSNDRSVNAAHEAASIILSKLTERYPG